jgi:hypothetical protein
MFPSVSVANAQGMGTRIPQPSIVRHDFMKVGTSLTDGENKYCRCLLEVESKGKARSSYGICTKSTGNQVHSCSAYYDWPAMDLSMLLAYLSLHKVDTSNISSREQALKEIAEWKKSRGEKM